MYHSCVMKVTQNFFSQPVLYFITFFIYFDIFNYFLHPPQAFSIAKVNLMNPELHKYTVSTPKWSNYMSCACFEIGLLPDFTYLFFQEIVLDMILSLYFEYVLSF